MYGGVEVWFHAFLTSALNGDQKSASRPDRFTPGYPLYRRLGEPQSQSGRGREETLQKLLGNVKVKSLYLINYQDMKT
jgi:hypothetical protein